MGGRLHMRTSAKTKGVNSPLETALPTKAANMTTVVQSPRTQTPRSGAFSNGQLTLRGRNNTDDLGNAFDQLRDDINLPESLLNNTVDVEIKYNATQPIKSKTLLRSIETGISSDKAYLDLKKSMEAQIDTLKEGMEEQKSVINQLIDQLTQKTLELAEMKTELDDAFKQAAYAKTDLATAKIENEELKELNEILRSKIDTKQKTDVKR